MTEHRILHEQGKFRILEVPCEDYCLDDLLGDGGTPEEDAEVLELASREGVYGYVLEYWNSSVGTGGEHIDSCFGFIGQYSPSDASGLFNHYIVEELKRQIVGTDS